MGLEWHRVQVFQVGYSQIVLGRGDMSRALYTFSSTTSRTEMAAEDENGILPSMCHRAYDLVHIQ